MADTKEKEETLKEDFVAEEDYVVEEEDSESGVEEPTSPIERYRLIGGAIVGGILAIIGVYFLFDYFQEEKEKEGMAQSIYAFRFFEQDSINRAIKGSGQYPGLEKIVEEYGGSKAGDHARLLLGAAYYMQGQVDKGLEQFSDVNLGSDNMPAITALIGQAYGYEEKKDFSQAAELYEKAAETQKNQYTTPLLLMEAARCYEEVGNKEKALKIYQSIKKQYPLSEAGKNVEKYIAKLSN
ncbi:MAG: tetratricopeptide repeat protein [Bacteroidia bacterium]|nr:tetratricopeptide repeat protein [Bacteroidia bacterium]MDW8157263.1 tetratricopeptide repeat protein [Bacteroidia bacterium]